MTSLPLKTPSPTGIPMEVFNNLGAAISNLAIQGKIEGKDAMDFMREMMQHDKESRDMYYKDKADERKDRADERKHISKSKDVDLQMKEVDLQVSSNEVLQTKTNKESKAIDLQIAKSQKEAAKMKLMEEMVKAKSGTPSNKKQMDALLDLMLDKESVQAVLSEDQKKAQIKADALVAELKKANEEKGEARRAKGLYGHPGYRRAYG